MPARRGFGAGQWLARAPSGRSRAAPGRTVPPGHAIDLVLDALSRDDDEDELARLVEQVREARERLSRLITAVQAERTAWDEREQWWESWRSQLRNPPRKPPRRDVH
jgi:hypothetical protein